jgi:allophanate hydrolase
VSSNTTIGWTLAEWRAEIQQHPASLRRLLQTLRANLAKPDPAWIYVASEAEVDSQLAALDKSQDLPLYGIPFAVKDNIDVAGMPTTAACPAFSYVPSVDATSIAKLRAAGAIVMGKTNLDQFATGLVGTRSPYGIVPNTFNERYVSGGSSSGSASAVARGLVPFSLGTDTAGSGRVPAGFNNIVGLKPTKGRVSTRGVVPACRSLDCVSVFALTLADADTIAAVMSGFDAEDAYSRKAPPAARRSPLAIFRRNLAWACRYHRIGLATPPPPAPGTVPWKPSKNSARKWCRWISPPCLNWRSCFTVAPGWRSAMPLWVNLWVPMRRR